MRYECCAKRSSSVLVYSFMYRYISLSNVFSKNDERLIGLISFGEVLLDLAPLGIDETFYSCHTLGMCPQVKHPQKMSTLSTSTSGVLHNEVCSILS